LRRLNWCGDNTQSEDPLWIVEAIKKNDVWFTNEGSIFCQMKITTLKESNMDMFALARLIKEAGIPIGAFILCAWMVVYIVQKTCWGNR